MAKRDHVEHLRKVALLANCNDRDLAKIARAGDELTVRAGEVIVEQGQVGHEAFVVLEGSAVVRRNGRKVTTLGPGAVLGELSLLDHGPRTATAVAATDCVLLVLEQRRFLGVLDEVPTLSHKLLAVLAARIRELDRKVYG